MCGCMVSQGLLSLIHGINSTPVVCVDIHGHSRRFNGILFYYILFYFN